MHRSRRRRQRNGVNNGTVIAGPFSLRYHHLFVKERSPGVYILSRNGRSADLVGGSFDDVADALRRVGRQAGYRYCWFAYVSTREECEILEHEWLHRYSPQDNRDRADTPVEKWRCSRLGCAACALASVRQ